MVNILFILGGAAAAFHAYTYGRWLKGQGNAAGAVAVFALAAAAAALPVYHFMAR